MGDGTLLTHKILAKRTRTALLRWKASGRKLVLVTGETVRQLGKFPELRLFDLVVAENGAVLYRPDTGKQRVLGRRPPLSLLCRLRQAGVRPLHIGKVIVSPCEPGDRELRRAIDDLGLSWHVVYNRKEAMALPNGIDKATSLRAALKVLGVVPAQVVGVGDAQNDVALVDCCELVVAVATAEGVLKAKADVILNCGSGRGVVELIDNLLLGRALLGWEDH